MSSVGTPGLSLRTLARPPPRMMQRTSLVVSILSCNLSRILSGFSCRDLSTHRFSEKMGIPRVLEALESNDWDSLATADEDDDLAALGDATDRGADDDDGAELDPEGLDFGFDREDFEGLKKAIWEARVEREGDDGDSQAIGAKPSDLDQASAQAKATGDGGDELGDEDIQKVEQMMRKLQAVKDMSAGLPEDQRKRMAAKAVGEVMKEL